MLSKFQALWIWHIIYILIFILKIKEKETIIISILHIMKMSPKKLNDLFDILDMNLPNSALFLCAVEAMSRL